MAETKQVIGSEPVDVVAIIEKAAKREYEDDHLTKKERQEVVDLFELTYKDDVYTIEHYPFEQDLNSKYSWILEEVA